MAIDLVPFGFTQTESAVYGALLELGPSGGYAIGRQLGMARANAYQALDGLVTKDAARRLDGKPRRYRAARPQDLLARIGERVSRSLDRLEEQIRSAPPGEEEAMVAVTGRRPLLDLVTRVSVRAVGSVSMLGPPEMLESLAPGLRARAAAGGEVHVWSIGRAADVPASSGGIVSDARISRTFREPPLLVATRDGVVAASTDGETIGGYWTSVPVLMSAVVTAIEALAEGR